jgi:hypothetical protein
LILYIEYIKPKGLHSVFMTNVYLNCWKKTVWILKLTLSIIQLYELLNINIASRKARSFEKLLRIRLRIRFTENCRAVASLHKYRIINLCGDVTLIYITVC